MPTKNARVNVVMEKPHALQYQPSVKSKDIPRLDSKMKERIKRAIETRLTKEILILGILHKKDVHGIIEKHNRT